MRFKNRHKSTLVGLLFHLQSLTVSEPPLRGIDIIPDPPESSQCFRLLQAGEKGLAATVTNLGNKRGAGQCLYFLSLSLFAV